MEKHKVLDQILVELHRLLRILDKENLSGSATIQKGLLSDLLQSYRASNGGDEEYIYMNKVVVAKDKDDKVDDGSEALANGKPGKYVPAPRKSLPDLPPPRTGVMGREPFPLPPAPLPACMDSGEGYYEEAQPYEETVNDDGEAVSSSYESYDEEEASRGKCSSAQHQWPSTEASIELMKDARICAFLWRKKWLGQWAKQLCVIRDQRLMCYKSSKEQTPLLDVSLLGCSVVYKEKQPKRKEHKLKIVPLGGEAIVLGLQSREQTEQWLRVIQEISPRPAESCEPQHGGSDAARLICTKGELSERHSVASESGSSTDSHADTPDTKDVKKKYGAGLKFSNLMNIGKKKTSSLESPEKSVDTSGYLNVLVNSQWRSRWCQIRDGHLCFYLDKGKSKVSQPAVALGGCRVEPDPSPDHLYSFRIHLDGEQLAVLEAKTSAVMGHWLGLLLSQTGTKTDPEELIYDYVNSERISSIVNAAKTSLYLMQRRFSEPNAYIDSLPSVPQLPDDLYDDVASIGADQEDVEENVPLDGEGSAGAQETAERSSEDQKEPESPDSRVYLDLTPVRSFLHTSKAPVPREVCATEQQHEPSGHTGELDSSFRPEPEPTHTMNGTGPTPPATSPPEPSPQDQPSVSSPGPVQTPKVSTQTQEPANKAGPPSLNPPGSGAVAQKAPRPASPSPHSPQAPRGRSSMGGDKTRTPSTGCCGAVEVKLGKNRTEADVRRYTDERDRLEKEREEVRSSLGNLKKERRESREELNTCQDPRQKASLEATLKQKEEACWEAEQRRVEVELRLVEVKESLRKVEAGPFTLGTTLDSSLQDAPTPKAPSAPPCPTPPSQPPGGGEPPSPVNSATALKNRPASIMATSKGNVLQKAKEWEKKSTS